MSNNLGQLVFPFSQVLPMKLKREWTVAISKPARGLWGMVPKDHPSILHT